MGDFRKRYIPSDRPRKLFHFISFNRTPKMKFSILILFLIVQVESLEPKKLIEGEIIEDNVKNITNITLGDNASRSLFRQWQDQAVSGLMAAVASKKLS